MNRAVHSSAQTMALPQTIRVWISRLNRFCERRWIPWTLFILALARNVVLLLAYPPAHGADSAVYFIYAERFLGFNAPAIADLAPPLYPVLILLSYKMLGSIYWLIALQFLLSALLPILGYAIGKLYQPLLGLLIGLIILGDVQVAVLYNFTSTEPPYIFLLMVTFWLYLRTADATRQGKVAFLVGVLLELLTLTRAVSRYLILPLVILFALMTRRYRLAGYMIAGFLASILVYLALTFVLFGRIEGFTTSNINMVTVFRVKPEWIQAENGTNSATYLDVTSNCAYPTYFGFVYCLRESLGGWDQTQTVLGGVYSEILRHHFADYLGAIWEQMDRFLAMSGQQLGWEPQTPSEVQCTNPEKKTPQGLDDFTHLQWPAILPDFSPGTLEDARQIYRPIAHAFCPPLFQSNQTARQMTDAVAVRYRSLGRPQPLVWYGLLFVLALILPSARRYRTLVLAGLAMLFNHALVSALVLSVQPRYVVVVNPIRAILLSVLIFIVMEGAFRIFTDVWERRIPKFVTPSGRDKQGVS